MKITPFYFSLLLLASFLSCASNPEKNSGNVNGFFADPGSYEIVNYKGKSNVIKVKGSATTWAVVMYSLEEYKGEEITIHFSADVRREGSAGTLNWQVNNTGTWPSVTSLENAATGDWHHMYGKLIVTPTENNPYLYLTNWENNAKNTVYYIANTSVTVEKGNPLNPDLSLLPLKSAYSDKFLIGNIIDWGRTYSSGLYHELLLHHYNTISSAVTYPVLLAPEVKGGEFRWEAADQMIDLVRTANIPVHGHVLVWHEASPRWMTTGTKQEIEANLKKHVTAVVEHFKGRIASWDVVNEAFRDDLSAADVSGGKWKNCIRKNESHWEAPWFDKLGPEYVEIAFRTARAADPDATLYYNDFNLYNQNKVQAVWNMINDINTRYKNETGGGRNLIEGIGMQGHYGLWLNVDDVRKSLDKFITLGIEIAISELDISTVGYAPGAGKDTVMSESEEIAQARLYAKLFRLFGEYSDHITRVTMWGIDDGTSWLSAGNPGLFDWKLNAKKAFYAASDPGAFLAQYGE